MSDAANEQAAAALTAIVDPVTGVFCEDGMAPGRVVVAVPDNPDARRHRYSGDPENPIRTATSAEITARDAAIRDASAAASFDADLDRKAMLYTALWTALGHQPTAAEIATAKTRFVAVRKALS